MASLTACEFLPSIISTGFGAASFALTQNKLESVELTAKECTFLDKQPIIPDEGFQERWTLEEKKQVLILKRRYEKWCPKKQ